MKRVMLTAALLAIIAGYAQAKPRKEADFRQDRGVLVIKPKKYGEHMPISQVRTRAITGFEQLGYTVDQMNTARRPWRYTVMEKHKNGWLIQIVIQERGSKVKVSGFCFSDAFEFKYRSWQGGQIEELTQREIVFVAHNAMRRKLPELYLIDPNILK
jgi:hypothetical protein